MKEGRSQEQGGKEKRGRPQFLRLPLATKFQINLVFLLLCPPFNPLMQVENLTPLYWWGLLQLSCVAQNSYLFHPHLLLEFISCAKLSPSLHSHPVRISCLMVENGVTRQEFWTSLQPLLLQHSPPLFFRARGVSISLYAGPSSLAFSPSNLPLTCVSLIPNTTP